MTALPSVLPPGLFEAASRRGPPPARQPVAPAVGAIPRQFTGPQRTSSPLARAPYGTPPPQVAQTTGSNWLVTPQEKAKYDSFFANVDTGKLGYITGDQAVKFFSDSGLSEDALAQIWDLADVRSEGQLNREEFAVAMYLIRQQRSGSAPLPAFLPAALMPPSMRNQPQSQQTTAPAFDNANNASQMPKTAADDLFGLDSPPRPTPAVPVMQPQTTGSTATGRGPFDADPFSGSKPSSPISPARAQFQPPQQTGSSMFRPFQPSSAFGASLASQNTGGSQGPAPPAQQQQQQQQQQQSRQVHPPSAMDDLLGDNDEEQSKKLTEDTTELANMSTQVGNLRNQMQEVQGKKTNTERDLAATNSQKQELQQRLAQFRAQYQQEVQAVKSLEQQLATSKSETQKLQQDLAMIEGTHEDLRTQHQQVTQQFETDQRENTSLKERINKLNTEIAQLKPQIEKMRSDARQQKGMVAINKKQLATNENERDRLQSDMSDLSKAAAEQEQARSIAAQAPEPRSAVVSPTPSMGSRNPFFRSTAAAEGVQSPGVQSPGAYMASAPSPSAFDSLFGPAKASSRTDTPPPTSFHNREAASGPSSNFSSSERPTPTGTPAPGIRESTFGEAPPPPESRQFTPGMLPIRPPPSRDDSIASSTRVVPSHTNYGGSETPTISHAQPAEHDTSSTFGDSESHEASSSGHGGAFGATAGAAAGLAIGGAGAAALHQHHENEQRPKPLTQDSTTALGEAIPGAFPEESPAKPEAARSTSAAGPSALANATSSDDFDAAFAGFGGQQAPGGTKSSSEDAFGSDSQQEAAKNEEFYPMTQVEESDSEDEHGFDDNFGSSAPHENGAPLTTVASGEHREFAQPETPSAVESSAQSGQNLPPPPAENAVQSPPTYAQAAPFGADLDGHHERSSSSNQPPEFEGLLPARENPTTSPVPHSVPQYGPEQPIQSPGYGPEQPLQSPREAPSQSLAPPGHTPNTSSVTSEAFHDAASRPQSTWTDVHEVASQPQTSVAKKSAFDDEFDDFDNLTEAQTGDDKTFDFANNHEESEFNPTFDSPSASTIGGFGSTQQTPVQRSAAPASNGFHGFESNGTQPKATAPTPFAPTSSSPQAPNHDWDAIFSGLDAPPNIEPSFGGSNAGKSTTQDAFDIPTPKATSPVQTSQPPRSTQPPQLSRAMTTEHDDPILKRLTGMGYSRENALDALEKYDYDINKVSQLRTGRFYECTNGS